MGDLADNTSVAEANRAPSRAVVNIWVVDNQPGFQQALANALDLTGEFVLAGCFVHPEDALLGHTGNKAPDVILMDVQQFGSDGIDAVRQFKATFPEVHLIILTDSLQEDVISGAICAGASGYLLKTSPLESIPESIREVLSGGALLQPTVAYALLEMFRRLSGKQAECGLTARELRVLDLMGRGLVMKEIAEQLAISYHTVDTHSRNIYAKLGVHTRSAAVAKALRSRII